MKLLMLGSTGDDVKALQLSLNSQGEQLDVDGIYNITTHNAVMRAQCRLKEPINGNATPILQAKLGVKPWVEPKASSKKA